MHSLKRVHGFFCYGTIGNPLRFALGIFSGNTIFKFANPAGLRPCRICLFTDGVVTDDGIGCCRLCSRRAAGTAEQLPAADVASRYDPLVKMRLERPAGRDKRQYKNKFSAEYPQSEAEAILNRIFSALLLTTT